jgi:hypothetical protein
MTKQKPQSQAEVLRVSLDSSTEEGFTPLIPPAYTTQISEGRTLVVYFSLH